MKNIHVCAAVIRENGRILVSDRPSCGKWEFPGGKTEPGESFGECIRRELREELNLDVLPLDVLYDFFHTYPEVRVHLTFLRCVRVPGSEPVSAEGQHFRWIPVRGMDRALDFLEADQPIAALFSEAAGMEEKEGAE